MKDGQRKVVTSKHLKKPNDTNQKFVVEEEEDTFIPSINSDELYKIHDSIAGRTSIIDDILAINPKIITVIETISSLIVSPNDMFSGTLNFSVNEELDLPTEILSQFKDVSSSFIESEYNFMDTLDTIIKNSLYTHGGHCIIHIPRHELKSIQETIPKQSTEAGLLSAKHRLNTLNIKTPKNITLTNSLAEIVLSNSLLHKRRPMDKKIYSHFGDGDIVGGLLNHKSITENITVFSGGMFNDINDTPIHKTVNIKNIIPIADRDTPSIHYGYLYLTDTTGRTIIPEIDYGMTANRKIDKIFKDINANRVQDTTKVPKISNIKELQDYIMEDTFKDLLASITGGDNSVIKINDELILGLATKILEDSPVNIIFLPPELVSYYAIEYRENGTGRPLIEKISTLASIRALMSFNNMSQYIGTGRKLTNVTINLDDKEQRPKAVTKSILAEIMANDTQSYPINMLKVNEIAEWSRRNNYRVTTNHTKFPNTTVNIDREDLSGSNADSDTLDKLDRDMLSALYATPSMISDNYSPEYAIEIRQGEILLNKRIARIQKKYNVLITSDIRKRLLLNGDYITKVKTILNNNLPALRKHIKNDKRITDQLSDIELVNHYAFELITNLNITLQTLTSNTKDKTTEEFEDYLSMVDKVIETFLSSSVLPDNIKESLSGNVENISAGLKLVLVRKYMTSNNVMPEFTKLFNVDENGDPTMDTMEEYKMFIDTLESVSDMFTKFTKVKEEKEVEEVKEDPADDTDNLDEDVDIEE